MRKRLVVTNMKLYSILMVLICIAKVASRPSENTFKKEESKESELKKEWGAVREIPLRKQKLNKPIHTKEVTLSFDSWGNCKLSLLYCRNGFYVEVKDNEVVGMVFKNFMPNDTGLFQIETYGKGFVMLRHVKSNSYISMDKKGNLRTSAIKTEECLFYYHLEKDDYATFASAKYYVNEYYDLYISLRKNGKVRKSYHSSSSQFSSQFELLPKLAGIDKQCIRN